MSDTVALSDCSRMPAPILRFSAMFDLLTAAGCNVEVELHESGRHSIVVTDGSGRMLRAPVADGFDRTATVIVMSGALRQRCVARDVDRDGWVVRGDWPELEALGLPVQRVTSQPASGMSASPVAGLPGPSIPATAPAPAPPITVPAPASPVKEPVPA